MAAVVGHEEAGITASAFACLQKELSIQDSNNPWLKAWKVLTGEQPQWTIAIMEDVVGLAKKEHSEENVYFEIDVQTMRRMFQAMKDQTPIKWSYQDKATGAITEGVEEEAPTQEQIQTLMTYVFKHYVQSEKANLLKKQRNILARYAMDKFSFVRTGTDDELIEGEWKAAAAQWKDKSGEVIDPRKDKGSWGSAFKELSHFVTELTPRFVADQSKFVDVVKAYKGDLEKALPDCFKGSLAHSGHYNSLDYRSLFDDSAHYHHEKRADYIDYSHPSPLNIDNSGDHYWSGFMVGGVFGGVAILFILVVFCIGLAFGIVTSWAYMQQIALDKCKDREVYWKANDNENENESNL